MCVKNNTHMYVAQTSNNRVILSGDLYCWLVPQCEALRTCHSGFPIAIKWCCDQDVKVVPGATFAEKCIIRAVHCKKEGMLLQPLHWRCVECAIHHERDVRKEQYPYICGANKQ